MPTTNVKIFTGFVQQEQLAQDMGYLKRSLNKLRAIFATRGVRLRTDQCDTNDPEQIRESVADSDVCVFLFQNDVPDLARAQFDAAYAQLVSGVRAGSPSIFVWFRDVDDAQVSDGLREFQVWIDARFLIQEKAAHEPDGMVPVFFIAFGWSMSIPSIR